MMRALAALYMLAALSGCMAGISKYTVEPFYDAQIQQTVCCRAQVTSGKNVGTVTAHIVKDGDKFTVDLKETGVNASDSITAAAAPVSDVAKAISDTATTLAPLIKEFP
jgi:hypothetical protein